VIIDFVSVIWWFIRVVVVLLIIVLILINQFGKRFVFAENALIFSRISTISASLQHGYWFLVWIWNFMVSILILSISISIFIPISSTINVVNVVIVFEFIHESIDVIGRVEIFPHFVGIPIRFCVVVRSLPGDTIWI